MADDISKPAGAIAAPPDRSGAKACPHCGQPLSATAVVCRHCRRDIHAPHDAPPLVIAHDWEREQPPEKVVFTVRLPVSEGQWTAICYILTAAVGAVWYALAVRPPAPAVPTNPSAVAPIVWKSGEAAAHDSFAATPPPEKVFGTVIAATPPPSSGASFGEPVASSDATNAEEGMQNSASGGEASESVTAPPVGGLVPDQQAEVIPATQLISDYDNHTDIAQDRYSNKTVTVEGQVQAAGRSADGTYYVLLVGTSDTRVRCLFPAPQEGKHAPTFTPGDDVTIRGTCQGRYVDVMMSDCSVVAQ